MIIFSYKWTKSPMNRTWRLLCSLHPQYKLIIHLLERLISPFCLFLWFMENKHIIFFPVFVCLFVCSCKSSGWCKSVRINSGVISFMTTKKNSHFMVSKDMSPVTVSICAFEHSTVFHSLGKNQSGSVSGEQECGINKFKVSLPVRLWDAVSCGKGSHFVLRVAL